MSKTNKRNRRSFKNKSVKDLIKLLKRMNKREDALIEQIRDLEFYMATLEEDFFEDTESEGDIMFNTEPIEAEQLHTMEEILAELHEVKNKKDKKNKKGKRKKK
jgi:hypothetical protein